ncbi:MAG: hypothetical protein Q9170_003028 [Blastenia crenularia]
MLSLFSAIPRPETVGAGGTCEPPDVEVQGALKIKDGPHLVTGARVDANPNEGGASFTQHYSVTITKQGGVDVDLDSDFSKILKKGLGFDAESSVSRGDTAGVSGTVICPQNTLSNAITT